ncbi:hypothetical protein A6A08_15520 [Nocardiopsis sp. TSRI0078]|uniref:hypothetical protein n=1 Tax=unclassified Nocardiopsis TaxID=2649073 RepID=UPI00093AA714|nr:hypothetical protein [Nocardiopsis sp. TSRI0078]OKI13683.1 hypothetical protein A6A08_15520 [Nocardiopsis sp. TSRI0078]
MPTQEHEIPLRIVQNQPALAPFLLRKVLGYELPEHTEAVLTSSYLSNCTPKEWTSDEAVVLRDGTREVLAIAVERQDGRDKDKRHSWPVYLSTLYGRLECPTVLVVLCPSRAYEAARKELEGLMSVDTYEWQSDFARKYVGLGREEGREEGLSHSVIAVLQARGLTVSDEVRRRIESCTDLETLKTWVPRAVTVERPEHLFD